MNLYDKDDGFRCFTLEEANRILPEIIETTEEAFQALESAKQKLEADKVVDEVFAYDRFENESQIILDAWAERIIEMGVYPKGYFTVDFKSPIPDTLFCWTYGEKRVSHTHKIYESFKDRVPIANKDLLGFEQSLN